MPSLKLLKPATMLAGLLAIYLPIHTSLAFNDKANNENEYSIYLIRHAEKKTDKTNPDLTRCGHSRARQYAMDFNDVSFNAIYSSDYKRTVNTAKPVAESKELAITHYDPRQLKTFSEQLIKQEQTALVVGHSNTTAVLAGMLSGQELSEFSESEYDRIYRVEIKGGQSILTLTRQEFTCPLEHRKD
ncbi:phosphoglycerate mutase family protein [Thalassotalea sp. PS06]|uniref:phosphoglycerate mutase family protein n=1 Tax=Thalassotalea sp. PS06 TaxID=2594005 RepID=UPI001162893E|nr:phosphoglycerate mutase family protein [Thalassotalea sp. PS06]QDP02505.1 histidine phosphatase family protein [Thalassotalea sp. PS06]